MDYALDLKVMMVAGAGHSGSTLLGMILGGHSRTFYMGEGGKARYLGDSSKPMRKRVCKICGEDCPVWSGFVWDQTRALHPQVARQVHKHIIIDSTKQDTWIDGRAAELRKIGARPHLILLTRDGRAVVNSRIRKYPERDPATQIDDWMAQMRRSEAVFERFDGPRLVVRYEELSLATEKIARQICDLLEIDYEPTMISFAKTDHHVLGGNSGTQFIAAGERFDDPNQAFVSLNERTRTYYKNHHGGIELDLRWKSELSAEHAALFERLAGSFNKSMKWEA
jgi:hypothetical protein